MRYKLIGYKVDVMRQSACLVVNPITDNNFAVLFNCMPVGLGSAVVVLHSCICVYLWHASNVATFIADRFASCFILCFMS